jgi:hypothetical protein
MAYNTTLTIKVGANSVTVDPIRFMNMSQNDVDSMRYSSAYGVIGRKFKADETPSNTEDQYTVTFTDSALNADPAWGEWFARQILTALAAPPWVANIVATAPPTPVSNITIS